jgi:3-dehydroquinate synthase
MALQIEVELADRRYPILIGQGLLRDPNVWSSCVTSNEVLIVTNATIAEHYLARCQVAFANHRCHTVILPDGEQHKHWQTLNIIFDGLMAQRFSRSVTLVALGGGVIGDMTGFAAACYQRGVPFVQIPTTLLAQVDSSVGGKTGINHPLGKNMIGAFYQPQAVIIDTETLSTLPAREYAAGLAEVIKYGLIYDADFFAWLEANVSKILARDALILTEMIARCCVIKAEVVAQDEHETTGMRAILNLGHTFGHAIEAVMGYGTLLHGEAVAIGMVLALKLSVQQKRIEASVLMRTQAWLKHVGLSIQLPTADVDALFNAMQHDKKKFAAQLRLILLDRLGHAVLVPVAPDAIKTFLTTEVHHVKK